MEEKCKIAIVGCGAQAEIHLRTLAKTSGLRVAAVCDTDKEKAITTSTKFNIHRQ